MDNLFETFSNISKAQGYDILAAKVKELEEENKRLKSTFYTDICRAYNAGKENMFNVHKAVQNGDPDGNSIFISSHDYFISEFPNFKTNVP